MLIENKYKRWYDAIIAEARREPQSGYVEKHHIMPKKMGGTEDASNLINLSYRRHYLAHWLLIKFTDGNDKRNMKFALQMMTHGRANNWKRKNRVVIAPWQYELARRASREAKLGKMQSAEHRAKTSAVQKALWDNPDHRAMMSKAVKAVWAQPGVKEQRSPKPETRAKISAATKIEMNRPGARERLSIACSGWKHTDTAKQKIGDASRGARNANYGKKISLEQKAKMSASLKATLADPEVRAKMSNASLGNKSHLGHKHGAEARAKMSAAHKLRMAKRLEAGT